MDAFGFYLLIGGFCALRLILLVDALFTGSIRVGGELQTRAAAPARFRLELALAAFSILVYIAGMMLFPVPGREEHAPFVMVLAVAETPPGIVRALVLGTMTVFGRTVLKRGERPAYWGFILVGSAVTAGALALLAAELGAFA